MQCSICRPIVELSCFDGQNEKHFKVEIVLGGVRPTAQGDRLKGARKTAPSEMKVFSFNNFLIFTLWSGLQDRLAEYLKVTKSVQAQLLASGAVLCNHNLAARILGEGRRECQRKTMWVGVIGLPIYV